MEVALFPLAEIGVVSRSSLDSGVRYPSWRE